MSDFTLTEEQQKQLVGLTQSKDAQIMHRAQLILAYAEGKPTMQASLQAGISRGRARFWKRQFIARGMEIFDRESEANLSEGTAEQVIKPSEVELVEAVDQEHLLKSEGIKELSYPALQKTIGLTPDDSLAEAGKKVWLYHFAVMLSHEQGTLLGEDIEELHDMRVATRRMRSAFDLFGPAFEAKKLNRYLKGLRAIGGALGQVRDLDVIYEKGLKYQENLSVGKRPGLDPLLEEWNQNIAEMREKLIKHMQSEAYGQFKTSFNKFLQSPEEPERSGRPEIEATRRIRDIVPVILYNRYAQVRGYDAILLSASVEQLHALRIEFKKFRYALEYFREILDEGAGKAINEIKQYQDHLGEMHDADVACQLVSDFLKDWDEKQSHTPIAERGNPQPIVTYLAYLHAERYRLIGTFPALWQKFNRVEFRHNLSQIISQL